MNGRFTLFCLIGAVIGACAGAITVVSCLELVPDIQSTPELWQRYVALLLKGALLWSGLGVISGGLLFMSSLGETPFLTDTSGRPLSRHDMEYFDYRHSGSKIIYICAGLTLLNAFWLIPFLSEPGLTEPHSLTTRLFASLFISLTVLVGTFLIVLAILTLRARSKTYR